MAKKNCASVATVTGDELVTAKGKKSATKKRAKKVTKKVTKKASRKGKA